MKVFSVVLALTLGVGCIVAAAWLGSQPPKPDPSRPANSQPPGQDGVVGPAISPTGPYPKAVAPETEHDFGVGMLHSKGNHTFIIRNEGEAPLVLMAHERDRTCQCTGANLSSDQPIAPGAETEIVLSWEIKADVPQFRHSAKIRTNDPENKIITLAVAGRVEKQFQFDPPTSLWDLGDATSDTVAKSSKFMFSQALEKFDIKLSKPTDPRIQLTSEPMTADELESHKATSGYRFDLELDVTNFTGTYSQSVDVVTDDNGKELTSPLNIRIRRAGPIEMMARNFDAQTSRLALGEFMANEGKSVEISVYVRVDGDVNLVSAESAHDAVKAAWERDEKFESKSGKTRRYRLKLEIPPAAPVNRRRDESEKVDLKFDHPDIGTMVLHVDYLSV